MAEIIYGDYDRAALDIQYNARAAVPAFPAYVDYWQQASAEASRNLPCTLDVAYGDSDAETLDIFHPIGGGPAPVLIFFHGGYWRSGDKDWFRYLARPFVERGAAFVVANYGLCPAIDMDELVRQCRASVAWTHNHAGEHGGDDARLFVSGHSAGGHITAMMLATDWAATAGLPANAIKGAIGISGLYDLEPLRRSFVNEALGLSEESARRNSPTTLPLPAQLPPAILAFGGLESAEYDRQTMTYAEVLRGSGGAPMTMKVEGHHHYSVLEAFANPAHPFGRAVLMQMGLA